MFLGLDFGTSSVKALLVDNAQRVVASATRGLPIARPAPGHSEQSPQDWWQALLDTMDALRAERPEAVAALRGIGLSGQMHGAVLLDEANGEVSIAKVLSTPSDPSIGFLDAVDRILEGGRAGAGDFRPSPRRRARRAGPVGAA